MDYETVQSCTVTVTSTSSDDDTTSTKEFTIALTDHDEFDVSAPSDTDTDANTIAENIANGQPAEITASSSDADLTTNTVTYAITAQSCAGAFAIGENSGIVTVLDTNAIDREAGATCTLEVTATSTDTCLLYTSDAADD